MRLEDLQFFDPRAEIQISVNRLPHWQQDRAVCFVTFRLGDSVPRSLLDDWNSERNGWLRRNPQPWSQDQIREYHSRFAARMEQWLDAGHGDCVLRRPECATIVAAALSHFEGRRYQQLSWVVMPNHVHSLFALSTGAGLESVLHSWKRFTARRINELLGRQGTLWQRDYFDRLVRDEAHCARCVRYIRRNPEKARLRPGEYLLFENDMAREIE
jgi:putative transposase